MTGYWLHLKCQLIKSLLVLHMMQVEHGRIFLQNNNLSYLQEIAVHINEIAGHVPFLQ